MPDITSNFVDTIATGRASTDPFVTHFQTRDPTPQDVNFSVQKQWFNTTNDNEWILVGFISSNGVVTADWRNLTSGQTNTETLTGNTGGPVGVDSNNNINVVGDGTTITIAGNPATFTLTASTAGTVATTYTENSGTATPALGNLNILGTQGISTSGSGSTVTITSANGIPATKFDVDANTAPGTDPVVPTSLGVVSVTGGQVAAGTTANAIRTASLAANTYTIQVQRSQAVASSTVGDNGVCHFDSSSFSVDSNGFVTLTSSVIRNINMQIFTSNGTYTPTSGMQNCLIEVVGGGAGGGSSVNPGGNNMAAGSGGGGGEYSKGYFTAADIGASKAVTIGAGGAGATVGNNNAGNGGTSSVGALISANGGTAGKSTTAGVTDLSINGGVGGTGTAIANVLSSPGGYGSNAYGAADLSIPLVNCFSGGGGNSMYGSGGIGQGAGLGASLAGIAGVGYGGGGAGAISLSTGAGQAGGAGTSGVVIVTEYI